MTSSDCRFCAPGNPCRFHRPSDPEYPRFDPHQFRATVPTPAIDGFYVKGDTSIHVPDGFQVVNAPPRRLLPEWVTNPKRLKAVLTSHRQASRLAGKWARLIYLFYNLGLSLADVAEEMNMKPAAIRSTLRHLNARAKRQALTALAV